MLISIIFNEILEKMIEELNLNFKRSSANNLGDNKKTNFTNSYKYYSDLNNEIFKIFFFVERKKTDELIYEFIANSIYDINLANLKNFEILPLENIDIILYIQYLFFKIFLLYPIYNIIVINLV